jgi:hypothetical protein
MWEPERVRAALSEISYLAAWTLFIATLVNKDRDVWKTPVSFPALVKVDGPTYAIYSIKRFVGTLASRPHGCCN